MKNCITIKWAEHVSRDHILDTEHQTRLERIRFGANSRLYYVTGYNGRTGEKRIYIGKAGDTSVYERIKDHKEKHDMLNGCTNVEVRIGKIVETDNLNIDCEDVNLVDQAESILIHDFKNFKKEIGNKMIDNSDKVDSYTKYYDIKGINNVGDIDEMPMNVLSLFHNAIDKK